MQALSSRRCYQILSWLSDMPELRPSGLPREERHADRDGEQEQREPTEYAPRTIAHRDTVGSRLHHDSADSAVDGFNVRGYAIHGGRPFREPSVADEHHATAVGLRADRQRVR